MIKEVVTLIFGERGRELALGKGVRSGSEEEDSVCIGIESGVDENLWYIEFEDF